MPSCVFGALHRGNIMQYSRVVSSTSREPKKKQKTMKKQHMFTLEIMYVYILCIHTRVYSACIYAFKFMFLNQHVNPLQCEHVYGSDERIWNPLVMRLRSACFVVSDVCVWFGIYHQFYTRSLDWRNLDCPHIMQPSKPRRKEEPNKSISIPILYI